MGVGEGEKDRREKRERNEREENREGDREGLKTKSLIASQRCCS